MRLGYNTNGLSDHDLPTAIEMVAELGYSAIGITLDYHRLNPYSANWRNEATSIREQLTRLDLLAVVETGARYLLDPWNKHQPTLVSTDAAGRERRIDFLCRAIDIARELDAHAVSFWSGAPIDGADEATWLDRLCQGLAKVLAYAADRGVRLAFEPEPGMAIDTMYRYEGVLGELERRQIDSRGLGLTIDIGHLHCQGEVPISDQLRKWRDRIVNIHIEDMRYGQHEHLMFGEGEIDFPPVIETLRDIGYTGPVLVELSRHSHVCPTVARRSFEFLQALIART
jgi:L-ribulose-5-phosphate 3-epimerase